MFCRASLGRTFDSRRSNESMWRVAGVESASPSLVSCNVGPNWGLRSARVSRPRRWTGPKVSPIQGRPAVVEVRGQETLAQRVISELNGENRLPNDGDTESRSESTESNNDSSSEIALRLTVFVVQRTGIAVRRTVCGLRFSGFP